MTNDTIDTLQQIRAGGLLDEIGDELANLTRHVRETGRGGKLTITLTVSPVKKGQGEIVTIADEVRAKLPKIERPSTVLFTNDDGGLSRKDPRQPDLPLPSAVVLSIAKPGATGTDGAADSASDQR